MIVSEVCNKIIIELESIGSHAHALITATGSSGKDISLKHEPSKEEALGPEQVLSDGLHTGKVKGKKDEFGDNVELF